MGKDLKGKELGVGISQRKDGNYAARYVNRFGKRVSLYAKTYKEIRDALHTAQYEDKNKLNIVDAHILLDAWFEKWLCIYKYNVIRENTKRGYRQVYEKHISPVLGQLELAEITQLQIRALIKKLSEAGYRFETQNKVHIILLDMFGKAMNDQFVNRNPAKGIKVIRNEEVDIRVLSVAEQAEFFDCSKGTFYDNLFVTAVSSGLRPGELCALTEEDLDFSNKLIRVNKTLVYQKFEGDSQKTFHIDPPKTKSSERKVPMNAQCELALKKQMMQRNVIRAKSPKKPLKGFENLLFTTKYGTPINSVIYSDAIKRIVEEINLCKDPLEQFELFSGHCFRHTFATRCFEAGIAPRTVQGYLGHASLDTTMRIYTHLMDDHMQDEMAKLEEAQNQIFSLGDRLAEQRYLKKVHGGVIRLA